MTEFGLVVRVLCNTSTHIRIKIDSFLSLILCYFTVWSARAFRRVVSRVRTKMTSQVRQKADFCRSGTEFQRDRAKITHFWYQNWPKTTLKFLNRSQTLKAPTFLKKIWPKPEVLAKTKLKKWLTLSLREVREGPRTFIVWMSCEHKDYYIVLRLQSRRL